MKKHKLLAMLLTLPLLFLGCDSEDPRPTSEVGPLKKDMTHIQDGTQVNDGASPDSGPAMDQTPGPDVPAMDLAINEQGADQATMDLSQLEAGNPDQATGDTGAMDISDVDLTIYEAGVDGAGDAALDVVGSDGSPDAEIPDLGVDLMPPDMLNSTCLNTVIDGDETDLNCGGSCPPCADDLVCADGDDCQSGVCTNLTCTAPTCLDPVQNGDETGLNCGGDTCDPCGDGLGCLDSDDCESGVCGGDLLCAAPTCIDAVQNGAETALDCGGGTCDPCGNDMGCLEDTDCREQKCDSTTHLCLAATCDDLIQNGDETDQDCGGNTCAPCGLSLACALCTDCETTHCYDGQCVAPTATCAQILTDCPTAQDGTYFIDPTGGTSTDRFAVTCDMTTDGGGWTEITRDIALNQLGGVMVGDEAVAGSGFGGANNDSPYAAGTTGVSYHYSFLFLGGYTQFFLKDYQIQALSTGNDTSDIRPNDFIQTLWTKANGCPDDAIGDVSFGSSYLVGPTTSYARKLSGNVGCTSCITDWPGGTEIYAISGSSTSFRIGWGECGGQYEGWYPWYSGTILLR